MNLIGIDVIFSVMKKLLILLVVAVVFTGCIPGENLNADVTLVSSGTKEKNILLIAGEGGVSGGMFRKAVATYQKENGGEFYEVASGDEFIAAVRDFIDKNGKIDHLQFFGHGNEVGLYVNQAPNVNGAVYANDPTLNNDYVSASIFELPADIFSEFGWIKFNGCNVANGYPEINSLAQSFANYFDVDVVAPLGPTEFSSTPHGVNPIPNSTYLDPSFNGDVYMVPTYSDRNFVVVKPQEAAGRFADVRKGQSYFEAVEGLVGMGLDLGFTDEKFLPYKNISGAEARVFCKVFAGERCVLGDGQGAFWMRNLGALKMLSDAHGVVLKYTNPWYNSYVWWARNEGLLTKDFTNKKWYTRGEMAELTWAFVQKFGTDSL